MAGLGTPALHRTGRRARGTAAFAPPAVDGVRLHPAVLAADLPVLAADVLPALAAAGLHAPPVPGATLRTTLGLPHPANRFAAVASATV